MSMYNSGQPARRSQCNGGLHPFFANGFPSVWMDKRVIVRNHKCNNLVPCFETIQT